MNVCINTYICICICTVKRRKVLKAGCLETGRIMDIGTFYLLSPMVGFRGREIDIKMF